MRCLTTLFALLVVAGPSGAWATESTSQELGRHVVTFGVEFSTPIGMSGAENLKTMGKRYAKATSILAAVELLFEQEMGNRLKGLEGKVEGRTPRDSTGDERKAQGYDKGTRLDTLYRHAFFVLFPKGGKEPVASSQKRVDRLLRQVEAVLPEIAKVTEARWRNLTLKAAAKMPPPTARGKVGGVMLRGDMRSARIHVRGPDSVRMFGSRSKNRPTASGRAE